MSDPAVELPPGTLVLQILVTPEGRCSVSGAIDLPLTAYGLLKIGEKALDGYYQSHRAPVSGVQAAPASILRHLDGGRNGKP